MKPNAIAVSLGLLVLCACRAAPEQDQQTPNQSSALPNAPANVALPDDRTPLEEPNGPIDPNSAEAAGQVVQGYGALIEQKRWKEANALWSEPVTPSKFRTELAANSEVHLEIGNPGEPEGAAGSIYVTVPVIFYGDLTDGQPFRRSADVILRRVNDVPGSTDAQRRWHIERIDWTS